MSKGLGTLQRRLIEISTATQTIWQAMPEGIRVKVADTSKKTAHGITTDVDNNQVWRRTREPYIWTRAVIQSHEHLMQVQSAFRAVWIDRHDPTDSVLSACWSMHHIRATLWPELWREGDNKVYLQHPLYEHATFPQIPQAIKTARNAAQAGLSRAIASLEKRGMILYAGSTHSDAANAIWSSHGGSVYVKKSRYHHVSYITDGRLLKP